jgi:Zn-dependent metalloprotease
MNPRVLAAAAALLAAAGPLPTAAAQPAAADPTPSARRQADPVDAARRGMAAHPRQVRAAAADTFTVRSVLVDSGGAAHVRFDRTHAGLPVLGGDVVVHVSPAGEHRGADAAMSRPVAVDTTPRVPAATATAAAERSFKGSRTGTAAPILSVDATGDAGRTQRLVWDTVVHGVRDDQTPSRLHVLVDAMTGAVVSTFDEIRTGTGHGVHTGRVTFPTSRNGSAYQMVDPSRGNASTTNLDHGAAGEGTVFTDADDAWGNGTTGDAASAAVDAAYGAAATFDFYKNTLGRSGIWGDGRGTRSRVHYGDNFVNAFWDGVQMTYGDGRDNAHPLTQLDVVGHEMSHGVTQNTARLAYSGDAGGLNEATSDIMGTLVEFYAANAKDRPDYDIGELVDVNGDGTPLRYMHDPKLDGLSDSCWHINTPYKDPHFSSGPANHFFYLLAVGSSNRLGFPPSPTCDGSSVTGLGNDKAGRIWYRALSAYMVSTESYARARQDTLRAATDLYGKCGTEYRTVQAAWKAVYVFGDDSCPRPQPPGRFFANTADVPIPDGGAAVESPVTVSGLAGNAPAGLQVGVEIRHTYRGDLAVDLVAPDGSTYRLKDPDPFDAVENVSAVYSVDASAEPANGTWRLRVRDVSAQDGGYLDAWDLTF